MNESLNYDHGFTLIELLIALTVFAILATITSTSLYYAFNTRSRVNEEASRIASLQMAVSILQQDISQAIPRAVRSNEMHLFPPIVGLKDYIEFTRDGLTNPNNQEKRSTLQRVAFVCMEKQLIARSWPTLDFIDKAKYEDKVLLDNLKECNFKYLNQSVQSLSEWREARLPKAIQINLGLNHWGAMSLLFIIPEGLYGAR